MSVVKVEMFTVVCDHCGKDIGSESDYSCWNDKQYAEDNAMDSDWHKEGDNHYCNECYDMDDEDNTSLVPERKGLYIKDLQS